MSEFYVNSEAEHSIPAYFKPKQSENMAKAANSSQPAATPRSTRDNKETSWSCGLLPLGRSITPLRKHKGKGVEEKLQEVPFWYFCHSSVSSCFTAHLENALFFLVTICRIQHLTWSQKGARCRWESWAKGCLLCETGTQHCWLAEPKLLPAILHTQGHLFHTGVGIASDLQPVLPLEQWENNFCGWLGTRTWVTVTSHVQRNQGMRSGAHRRSACEITHGEGQQDHLMLSHAWWAKSKHIVRNAALSPIRGLCWHMPLPKNSLLLNARIIMLILKQHSGADQASFFPPASCSRWVKPREARVADVVPLHGLSGI